MLFRKLIRTMGRYKAQFISMIIMIALGIGVFTGFNMEWYSIEKDTEKIFTDTGFADYRIISEKGFSKENKNDILEIDGVDDATRYISLNTTVKDDSDVIALTVSENINVSGFILIDGNDYDKKSKDGIWISDQYANKNNVKIGDSLNLVYKNIEIKGKVKGLIKSGEYMICVPDSTQLMPDFNSYGFAYISPEMFKKTMSAEFYTQINVKSDMTKSDFIKKADKALGETTLVLSKDENISYAEAQGESEEGKTMGSVLPVLFLAIAILTMVTTMHRLTANEKTQIGTLKSLGFKDRRILVHYTSYALMIGILGTFIGIALGYFLGWYIMNPNGAMGTYMDMQDWTLYMPKFCWIVIILINIFLTLIGFLSVKSMLKGTASDALRPYTPKKVKKLIIEETKFWKNLSFGTKWNMRDSLRHKSRTFMTLFGIVGCMILLVGALGMKDTIDAFVEVFYNKAINYETKINIDYENTTNNDAVKMAKKYNGDWLSQTSVQLNEKSVMLEVYNIKNDKVRFVNQDMKYIEISDDGAYICSRIADEFGVSIGDKITFSPYGSDEKYEVKIVGILRSLTESIVITDKYADKINFEYKINVVYTSEKNIETSDLILNTQSKQSIIDSFDTFMDLMVTMVFLLIVSAVILGIVVLYNLGVMSYTERYREMATLKVVGFKDKKIGRILIGQNIWITIIGIIIGIPCGIGVLKYLIEMLASEYEMSLAISWLTYLVSVLLTFGVSLIVGLMISRKNKKINMVEALKCPD